MTSGGAIVKSMRKSEKARLMTRRLDGVRRDLVVLNIWMTTKLPHIETLKGKILQRIIQCVFYEEIKN